MIAEPTATVMALLLKSKSESDMPLVTFSGDACKTRKKCKLLIRAPIEPIARYKPMPTSIAYRSCWKLIVVAMVS